MTRKELEAHIQDAYGIAPDYPFERDPRIGVFRHAKNKKWFGVIMPVPRCKLGLAGNEPIDVINLKCAEEILLDVRQERGIFPAYHMNKRHWLSVALDGSASDETVRWLVGISYALTEPRIKAK